MMYMFEAFEKQVLFEQRFNLSKYLVEGGSKLRSDLYTLALVNFIKRMVPSNFQGLEKISYIDPNNPKQLEELLANALEIVVKVATEEVEYGKVYTTGQLAKLLGVSITTIHNWLREGRFVGVELASKNKQTRIPESARWKSPSGELVTIREISEKYAVPDRREITHMQEQMEITNAIAFYENKYGCTYEEFQKKYMLEEANYEMRRDAREWNYLLQRIADRGE